MNKNTVEVQKDYLQNLVNSLNLVVDYLVELANHEGLGIEMIVPINDLVVMMHSINENIQQNEQREEFYVVKNDSVDLKIHLALQKLLGNEVF